MIRCALSKGIRLHGLEEYLMQDMLNSVLIAVATYQ